MAHNGGAGAGKYDRSKKCNDFFIDNNVQSSAQATPRSFNNLILREKILIIIKYQHLASIYITNIYLVNYVLLQSTAMKYICSSISRAVLNN